MPVSEKLVSLFKPHADIIRKGGRQVQYGHKLNLVTGKSGLIVDVVVEAGVNSRSPDVIRARPSKRRTFFATAVVQFPVRHARAREAENHRSSPLVADSLAADLGPKASASADRGAAKASRSRETGGRWAPAGPKWS